jgi:hypothetical protein
VVLKCLSKSADDRYSGMRELLLDLERVESGSPSVALLELQARRALGREPASTMSEWVKTDAAWGGNLLGPALGVLALLIAAVSLYVVGYEKPLPAPLLENGRASTQPPLVREVTVLVSPEDARVQLGDQDLGASPARVRIHDEKPQRIVVARPGFATRQVVIDGEKPTVVVELAAVSPASAARRN